MLGTGQVGPQVVSDGTETSFRLGKSSENIITELHGKYYEQAYRGNVFWATMTAGVIFPAVAATAANVMTLANPAASGKNISLISFDQVTTILGAGTDHTTVYGLYVNNNVAAAAVTGTAIAPIPGLIGAGYLPVAKPLSTSTIPAAPTLARIYGAHTLGSAAAATPITGLPVFHIDFDGSLILAPGSAVTPQITIAMGTTNVSVICSFVWEEVPI